MNFNCIDPSQPLATSHPFKEALTTACTGNFDPVKKLAETGNPDAQNLLGQIYRDGYVDHPNRKFSGTRIEKDDDLAVSYFIQSADQKNKQAQKNLDEMFQNGRGINDNTRSRALKYLEQTATAYGNSMWGTEARLQLSLLLKATDPGRAVLLFDEVLDAKGHGEAYHHIIDLLCSSKKARDSLGQSKTEDYLKDAADPKRMNRADAAYAYAELCSRSGYSLLRDGFGSPQETAAPYYEMARKASYRPTIN